MSAHTPGPWAIDSDGSGEERGGAHAIRTADSARWGIASVWHQSGGGVDGSRDLANARLIAAAPELLAAAEQLIASLDAGEPLDTSALYEAIAKARGGK